MYIRMCMYCLSKPIVLLVLVVLCMSTLLPTLKNPMYTRNADLLIIDQLYTI